VLDTPLSKIMQNWKSIVAVEANQLLERTGDFWQEDYWDTFMRDEEQTKKAIRYIENNPVKAKLCRAPEEWLFSSARLRDPQTRDLKLPQRRSAEHRSAAQAGRERRASLRPTQKWSGKHRSASSSRNSQFQKHAEQCSALRSHAFRSWMSARNVATRSAFGFVPCEPPWWRRTETLPASMSLPPVMSMVWTPNCSALAIVALNGVALKSESNRTMFVRSSFTMGWP
jgi:hypothetical protein